MRPLFYLLLISLLPLFDANLALAADDRPKPAGTDQPASDPKTSQPPAANQDSTQPNPGADANPADSGTPPDQAARPRKGSRPTSMAIIPVPGGVKTLTIHFRWSLYPNCSVEVRLVPGPEAKGATVAPIYFCEHLKDKVREALWKCLDQPGEGGRSYSFTKDKIVYKMIGRRNSLSNQGVHVQVRPEENDAEQANPAAAFLQLDTWAVDRETLSLDLARDEFTKAGTLFVWFFRGDQVVWEERIRWPGYGGK